MTGERDTYYAAHQWAVGTVRDRSDTSSCDCGHEGLGPEWHSGSCPWACGAYRRKLYEIAAWCDDERREPRWDAY